VGVTELLDLMTAEPGGLRQWALLVTMSAVSGMALYFGVGGYLYVKYYRRRRADPEAWKIQPKRFLSPKQHRWAIRVAASNMMLGGLLSGSFAYYVLHGGYTALYFDFETHGVLYTLASTVMLFLALEAAAYYTHRWLHGKWMFQHVHRWHHRCVAPTPFTTVTMHPVEFISLQATAFLPIFIIPAHVGSFIFLLVYVLLFNIKDHSGVVLTSWIPWQGSSRFHDDHHVYFHCNYGQNLPHFDRFHGTHRRVDRRYGEHVFGGKGARLEGTETSDDEPEFVKY
jgi:lathosterol oxidase